MLLFPEISSKFGEGYIFWIIKILAKESGQYSEKKPLLLPFFISWFPWKHEREAPWKFCQAHPAHAHARTKPNINS